MRNNPLRELARSFKYQMLYTRMKEGLSVRFFDNDSDFSELQLNFLYYLELYHNLNQSIYLKEPNLSYKHLESDIRVDAYLYWKSQQKDVKEPASKKPAEIKTSVIPTVQYRPRKRK